MSLRPFPSLFAALLGIQIFASQAECALDSSRITAHYHISYSNSTDAHELRLWRLDNQVIHQRAGISDHWRWQRDGGLTHIRYFDRFQRGIKLPAQSAKWEAKTQLLPDEALAQMRLEENSGEACRRTEKYETALKNGYLQVWWSPDLRLPVLLNRKKTDRSTTMKLTRFDTNVSHINDFFNQRYAYELFDLKSLGESNDTDFIDAVERSGIKVRASTDH